MKEKDMKRLQNIKLKKGKIHDDSFQRRIVFVINENDLYEWFGDNYIDRKAFINEIERLAYKRELSNIAKSALFESLTEVGSKKVDEDFIKDLIEKTIQEVIDKGAVVKLEETELIEESSAEVKVKTISDSIKKKLLDID